MEEFGQTPRQIFFGQHPAKFSEASAKSLNLLTAKGFITNTQESPVDSEVLLASVFRQLRRFEQRSTPHAHKNQI
jgi:hypothetical protein